jgi:hypothetical protein
MDNDIAVIHHQPASLRLSFDATFPPMLRESLFNYPVGQSVQHAIACGSTNNEIVREGSMLFYIQKEDIFAFFVFQCIDDGMGKFDCIQESPLCKISGSICNRPGLGDSFYPNYRKNAG